MKYIRKTAKGIILEKDAYAPSYNATIAGARCYKIWIARDLWDKVTAKWVDGTYTDLDGEKFRVDPEHLDNYLRVDDLLENFTDMATGAHLPGVRVLESRICQ